MVGHNPGFENLLINLLPTDDVVGVQGMATGTLAIIGFPAGFKNMAGNGRLQHLKRRKDLGL
jgi:hypothetical protein